MTISLKAVFQRNDQYEGVRRINIYLLRLLYVLMFFVLGKETWTHILTHQGPWDPKDAVVWCVWDGVRDFGGHRNHPSCENAADRAAGDILQSAVAHSGGVSTLVKGHVGGITCGRHYLGVLLGDITHRRCAVGIRVCELFLQTQESRTYSSLAVSGKHNGP